LESELAAGEREHLPKLAGAHDADDQAPEGSG